MGLAVALTSGAARAEIVTTGAAVVVPAPASIDSGALQSDTQINVFEETTRALEVDLVVDTAKPGSYGAGAEVPHRADMIPATTVVTSYFVHADRRDGDDDVVSFEGSVTFVGQVVGIVFSAETLSTSAGPLASKGTAYEDGGPHHPDLTETDLVHVHGDLRTVSFFFEQDDLWTPFWAEQDGMRIVVLAQDENGVTLGPGDDSGEMDDDEGLACTVGGRSRWALLFVVGLLLCTRRRDARHGERGRRAKV